jgi:hypothetical protein
MHGAGFALSPEVYDRQLRRRSGLRRRRALCSEELRAGLRLPQRHGLRPNPSGRARLRYAALRPESDDLRSGGGVRRQRHRSPEPLPPQALQRRRRLWEEPALRRRQRLLRTAHVHDGRGLRLRSVHPRRVPQSAVHVRVAAGMSCGAPRGGEQKVPPRPPVSRPPRSPDLARPIDVFDSAAPRWRSHCWTAPIHCAGAPHARGHSAAVRGPSRPRPGS